MAPLVVGAIGVVYGDIGTSPLYTVKQCFDGVASVTEARVFGVLSLIAVRPSHRRQGIGTGLLLRCEAYLRSAGATTLGAGRMFPHNPFYFGLYGGSEASGVLESDKAAGPFLRRRY